MATREASGAVLPEDAVPAALDAVPFGVVVLDEHQRVAYANRTAHRLLPNGLRIGEDAQWATVPQPPPERGTTDWGGGPDRADSPQIAITTLSGRLGGRVRADESRCRWPPTRDADRDEPAVRFGGARPRPGTAAPRGRGGLAGGLVDVGGRQRHRQVVQRAVPAERAAAGLGTGHVRAGCSPVPPRGPRRCPRADRALPALRSAVREHPPGRAARRDGSVAADARSRGDPRRSDRADTRHRPRHHPSGRARAGAAPQPRRIPTPGVRERGAPSRDRGAAQGGARVARANRAGCRRGAAATRTRPTTERSSG